MHRPIIVALISIALAHSAETPTGVPCLLNCQGRIAVNSVNFDGSGYFKFALLDGGSNQNETAAAEVLKVEDGGIREVELLSRGSGYLSPPAINVVVASALKSSG